jgi:hypothetical protein
MDYTAVSRNCSWAYVAFRVLAWIILAALIICFCVLVAGFISLKTNPSDRGTIQAAAVGMLICLPNLIGCWIGMAVCGACHAVVATARSQLGVSHVDDGFVPRPEKRSRPAEAPPVPMPVRAPMPMPVVTPAGVAKREIGQREGESLEAWAARMEAAEIASFKARNQK